MNTKESNNDKFAIYTYDGFGILHSQLVDDPIGYAEANPTKTFMAVAPDGEFYLIPPSCMGSLGAPSL